MALSALARNRRDRLYQEYAYLASIVAFIFLCLFFRGLTGSEDEDPIRPGIWHYGVMMGGLLVAPASAQVYHRVLKRYNPPGTKLIRGLYALAALQGVLCALSWAQPQLFPAMAFTTGLAIFGGMLSGMLVLVRVTKGIPDPDERARLSYMRWASTAVIALNAAEMSIHVYNVWNSFSLNHLPDLYFPPIGTLSAAVYIYFLGQGIFAYRLLDLREILANMVVFLTVAALLASIDGVLVLWADSLTTQRPSSTWINTFLASVVVLILYEPLHMAVERQVQKRFFKDRFEIRHAVERLQRRLPGLIETDPLIQAILGTLQDSQRADLASIYLWNDIMGGYVPLGSCGDFSTPPLAAVPRHPFAEMLRERRGGCALDALRRLKNQTYGDDQGRLELALRTMEGMSADLSLPLVVGSSVLGWLNVRDSRAVPGSGYRRDEVEALLGVVAQAAVLIDNTRQFARMKERDRLAALGEMAAGLAHEIRNPLGAIKGAAQLLKGEAASPEDAEFLGIIVAETNRLNRVVSQFLDYARPLHVEATLTPLVEVWRGAVHLLQTQGLPPGVDVVVETDAAIPAIPIDLEKMKQVALNLLFNALDAVKKGGTVRVTIRRGSGQGGESQGGDEGGVGWEVRRVGALTNPDADSIEAIVADDGPGIAEEDLNRLFIPFFTTKSHGTGLGLPLCDRVVRAHGGEIEVRSLPGRGTRFIVRLPVA